GGISAPAFKSTRVQTKTRLLKWVWNLSANCASTMTTTQTRIPTVMRKGQSSFLLLLLLLLLPEIKCCHLSWNACVLHSRQAMVTKNTTKVFVSGGTGIPSSGDLGRTLDSTCHETEE